MFLANVKADFVSDSINVDASSFVTKCLTHVQGSKCELLLESQFKTLTVTGIGNKRWRDLCSSDMSRIGLNFISIV